MSNNMKQYNWVLIRDSLKRFWKYLSKNMQENTGDINKSLIEMNKLITNFRRIIVVKEEFCEENKQQIERDLMHILQCFAKMQEDIVDN